MLNDFNYRRRVVTSQSIVAIHQRTLHQLQTFALARRQPVDLETLVRNLKCAVGDIESDYLVKSSILEQRAQQFAFAATKIDNALCSTALERRNDCIDALLIQIQ